MSSRNISQKRVVVPDDAEFIDFVRSDGDPVSWPRNTVKEIDSDGNVNFMEYLESSASSNIKWRVDVGRAVALALEYPKDKTYVLRDWPADYRMYDHHKGKEKAPRHDLYLHGPRGKRFRSVPEFIPHAIWLMTDETMDPGNCQCKYCTKRAQKTITFEMSHVMPPRVTSSSPGPSATPKRLREAKEKKPHRLRQSRVYSAVQPAPKAIVPPHPPRAPVLSERNGDVRAVHCWTSMKLKRWFRPYELVWVALEPSIPGPRGDVDRIRFWPALVDEHQVKPKAISKPSSSQAHDGDMFARNSPPNTPSHSPSVLPMSSSVESPIKADTDVPWSVDQSTQYKLKLLAVDRFYFARDKQVLPYQAHAPPSELIESLQKFPKHDLDLDPESLASFDPCPQGLDAKPADFHLAVSPYATALQIASKLAGYWCLTDDWEFKFSVTQSTSQPPPQPPPQAAQSLGAAIMSAGSWNATLNRDSVLASSSTTQYSSISAPIPNMPQSELQQLAGRTLGTPAQTQLRYQGLWWGAERIWIDDFVRLKVPRRCLAPNGAPNILPPAGPGKNVQEQFAELHTDPAVEVTAGARGVFMRLDGLFIVDVPQMDGRAKKECRASGMLYELADEDWEDPQPLNAATSQPQGAPDGPEGPAVESISSGPPAAGQSSSAADTQPGRTSPLSRPPLYPLPSPPNGYKFRKILPDGHEAVMSLSMISGRYYPGILSHPLLGDTLSEALNNPLEKGGLLDYSYIWALEGLSPGFFNSVDPTRAKSHRKAMLLDADKEARAELKALVEASQSQAKESSTDGPQVDELASPSPSRPTDLTAPAPMDVDLS